MNWRARRQLPALLAERPILAELLRDPENEGLLPFANEQLRQTAITLNVSDIYLMNPGWVDHRQLELPARHEFRRAPLRLSPLFRAKRLPVSPGRFHALGTTSLQRGYFLCRAHVGRYRDLWV